LKDALDAPGSGLRGAGALAAGRPLTAAWLDQHADQMVTAFVRASAAPQT
jgi:hypothetical protein